MQSEKDEAKKQNEMQIFNAFAKACPLDIDIESIVSCAPPEPDIRCRTNCGNEELFELTELINQSFTEEVARNIKIGDKLSKLYEEMNDTDRQNFDYYYEESDIIVSLREARESVPKKFLKALLKFLTAEGRQEKPFVIDLAETPNNHISKYIKRVDVNEVGPGGPSFNCPIVGNLTDPTFTAIKKKLKKTYGDRGGLNLLAYVNHGLPHPEFVRQQGARLISNNDLRKSPFKRIWIYNLKTKCIEYVSPPFPS